MLLRFIAYYTGNGFTETVFSSSWANDTYDVMLRPRLSSFDSAEIENEAERFEKIVKTISELLTIMFMSRTGIKYINYEKKTVTTVRVLDKGLQKRKLAIKQGCYIVQGTFKTFCRTDSVT